MCVKVSRIRCCFCISFLKDNYSRSTQAWAATKYFFCEVFSIQTMRVRRCVPRIKTFCCNRNACPSDNSLTITKSECGASTFLMACMSGKNVPVEAVGLWEYSVSGDKIDVGNVCSFRVGSNKARKCVFHAFPCGGWRRLYERYTSRWAIS